MKKRVLTPLWVLVVSLLFTAGTTLAFRQAVFSRDQARFQNAVESTQDRIANRLDTYVSLLLAARGLFAGTEDVTAAEFRGFVAGLELDRRYRGAQGIGFSRRLRRDQIPEVERRMREAGFADFKVWPAEPPREEMTTLLYFEPLTPRAHFALGYDSSTEPTRREAMQRARDTGLPAASRRVVLLQATGEEKLTGVIIYVPVVRNRELIGYVHGPLRIDTLFAGIFGSEQTPRVGFEVFDGPIDQANLMFSSHPDLADLPEPRHTDVTALTVGGATWMLRFRSLEAFEEQSSRALVPALFSLGVLLAGVLFSVTRGLARARAEAEAQRLNLHLLFTQTPAAVAVLRGPELRYRLSNPMNIRFSGGRAVEGKTIGEAMPELEPTLGPLARQVMSTGEPFVATEMPIKVRNDDVERTGYFNGTFQPLRGAEGTVEGIMVFAYEVTDLVVARQKVEAALRARDDFLSVAGHELRTPMTALALQLQGVLRQIGKGVTLEPSRLAERLGKAHSYVARIERLISELLDVSRISSGRLTLTREPVDLAALVAEVVDRFADEAAAAGCKLELGIEPGVVGSWDRSRVDQVLTNLVSNALKYGAGKPVSIRAGRAGDRAFVNVRDRGIGIAPEDRERIFERFERAVSPDSYGGLGLGLWISRQIVKALGGTVRVVASSPEAGTELRVELPL